MRLGTAVTLVAVAALAAACAGMQSGPRADAIALMQRDFHAEGIAGMDRSGLVKLGSGCVRMRWPSTPWQLAQEKSYAPAR